MPSSPRRPRPIHPPLPICCAPDAYALLLRQVRVMSSTDALIGGAVAVARHGTGRGDVASVDAQIQALADAVRGRVQGRSPHAVLAHLHAHLFEELGYRGPTKSASAPALSYLPDVLESRRGLPILLSLVYKLVADRLGLRVHGVGLPGHFVVGVDVGDSVMLVDPAGGGRVLDRDDCADLAVRATGDPDAFDPTLLAPVSHLHWLTRLLQNLLHNSNAAGRYGDLAAVIEMQMALWPGETQLQRDLALVLARLGMPQQAGAWLDSYLRGHPEDPQREDLEQLLDVLMT